MSRIEEWEINRYWEIFTGLNPVSGLLSGDKVAPVFKNSQLPDDQLEKIWDIADVDSDGNLDFEEFCIAMRLIYDCINGSMKEVPDRLPDWLVPASKAYLVTANEAVRQGSTGSTGTSRYDSSDDEDIGLSSDFNWYISPDDRQSYNAIYSANADYHGLISFNSLTELYNTLSNVPETDISSAWNLVNPRSEEKIDREQCIVFLHILNSRSKGIRVPRMVPASLRATFEKAKPEYNMNSKQAQVNRDYHPPSGSSSSKKNTFADGYLSRLGLGGRWSYSASGTDFTATKDTDWEEVRLKRKLEDLNNMIKEAEAAADRRKKGVEDYGSSRSALIRRELEQLLNYKEAQLSKLKSGAVGGGSQSLSTETSEDLLLITEQVKSLQEHEKRKREELEELKAKIAA